MSRLGAPALLATLLLATAPAHPASGALPAELRVALSEGTLAGAGTFRYWGFAVYQANLWIGPGFRSSAYVRHPFALELHYLRDFSGGAIASRSIDEMRRVGGFSPGQTRDWQSAMQSLFPDVRPGDRITGINHPGRGASFLHNGWPRGEIADPQFAELFFGIWLSGSSSDPGLRQALLGQATP